MMKNILYDIKVALTDAFDKNFERKAFFNEKWQNTKFPNKRGSLLLRTGTLRNSLKSVLFGNRIRFSSSVPYASIHNNGGQIKVTPKLKKYFWAMYILGGKKNNFHKAMALKKVGDTIKIPKRQFIGHHTEVDNIVKQVVDNNIKEAFNLLKNKK